MQTTWRPAARRTRNTASRRVLQGVDVITTRTKYAPSYATLTLSTSRDSQPGLNTSHTCAMPERAPLSAISGTGTGRCGTWRRRRRRCCIMPGANVNVCGARRQVDAGQTGHARSWWDDCSECIACTHTKMPCVGYIHLLPSTERLWSHPDNLVSTRPVRWTAQKAWHTNASPHTPRTHSTSLLNASARLFKARRTCDRHPQACQCPRCHPRQRLALARPGCVPTSLQCTLRSSDCAQATGQHATTDLLHHQFGITKTLTDAKLTTTASAAPSAVAAKCIAKAAPTYSAWLLVVPSTMA